MSALVTAARRYMGVPFRHRGRNPRTGLDCAGLVWCAYRDCGAVLPDLKHYGREPFNNGLVAAATEALGEPVCVAPVRMRDLHPGDVVLCRFDVNPHHVAIITDYPLGGLAWIHCDGHNGKVIETRLCEQYAARITHVFRRPV